MTASFSGLTAAEAHRLVGSGRLEIVGRLAEASNATFYCRLHAREGDTHCVYKPVAGERRLWDFPEGTLAGREVAAYTVSEVLGWGIVPPTAYRDGPYGAGMVQLWVDGESRDDLTRLAWDRDDPELRRMAIFDAVINNSDRKAGHVLTTGEGRLYGCDHGVSFAEEYKLRTVLWQWQGEPLPEDALTDLARLRTELERETSPVTKELARHLTGPERYATLRRVATLCHHGIHPYPPADWPAIPWPPV